PGRRRALRAARHGSGRSNGAARARARRGRGAALRCVVGRTRELGRALEARPDGGAARRRRGRSGPTARRARLQVEQLLQARGVPDRERLPVVVEVCVHVAVPRPDARRPFLQLRLAVVPATPAHAAMEADVRPRRREDLALAGEHERRAVLAQECVDVFGEPGLVAELERMPLAGRERFERRAQPVVIAREVRRQLPEERAELAQRLDARTEARDGLAEIAQPLDVRDVARVLHGEAKAVGRRSLPGGHACLLRQPVERVVHLDGVEVARVQLEPLTRWTATVERLPPARIVPARAAYADNASAILRHSSGVPAAATRERCPRSSSASPKGRGSSNSSIESPTSRQRSCAAAMSTDRASFSEQTPSTRPAARWHSESASEPITRRRCATPVNAAACSATRDVSVASKLRISICSFGRTAPSGAPSRRAPSPRAAVHSSPEPKSYT